MRIYVHKRVLEKRPWMNEADLAATWDTTPLKIPRDSSDPPVTAALGWDAENRLIEMLAVEGETPDTEMIYHAATATRKFAREMGFTKHQVRELFGRR